MDVFLVMNGWRLDVDGMLVAKMIESAVANLMSEEAFTHWVVDSAVPI